MERATYDSVSQWVSAHVPEDLFISPPTLRVDGEEVQIIGEVPLPEGETDAVSCISRFRERTRAQRMALAAELEALFPLKVSWGATCGDKTALFTIASVPVMTRLRFDERGVLDTLVDAGVARSRSDALAWCVRLVGEHEQEWLKELRQALESVSKARSSGPRSRRGTDT